MHTPDSLGGTVFNVPFRYKIPPPHSLSLSSSLQLKEMFGSGTACVVCPVNRILFLKENIPIPTMDTGAEVANRFYKELTDIQYGRREHKWSVVVE